MLRACPEAAEGAAEASLLRMNNKIDVRQFNFFYGSSQALIDLNLPIRENQITALIGPSGCGKSTFLRSLNRMNDTIRGTKATGEVLLDGKNVYDPDVDVVDLRPVSYTHLTLPTNREG